jgi:hypothetical protein
VEPWIQTAHGHKFDLLAPTVDMVDVLDIAHALSHICRFTGHVAEFFSVAQHSLLVADLLAWRECSPEVQLRGLFHDASEAYLSDLASPWKRSTPLGPPYVKHENVLMDCIADWANLPRGFHRYKSVEWADRTSLLIEARDLMGGPDWAAPDSEMGRGFYPLPTPFYARERPMRQVRDAFLLRYGELVTERRLA